MVSTQAYLGCGIDGYAERERTRKEQRLAFLPEGTFSPRSPRMWHGRLIAEREEVSSPLAAARARFGSGFFMFQSLLDLSAEYDKLMSCCAP